MSNLPYGFSHNTPGYYYHNYGYELYPCNRFYRKDPPHQYILVILLKKRIHIKGN